MLLLDSEKHRIHLSDHSPARGQAQRLPRSRVPRQEDEFIRIEDKYLLDLNDARELNSLARAHLLPSSPIPGTQFTRIESVYFDSPDLRLFKDHFTTAIDRFKIRTRRYAPNGAYRDDAIHVEIKRKAAGVCRKNRFQIGPSENHSLSQGKLLRATPAILVRNQGRDQEKIIKHLERVNQGLTEYGLRPTLRVTYARSAYEKNGFRVTLDDQLQWEPLTSISLKRSDLDADAEALAKMRMMLGSLASGPKLVLELKHQGLIPQWMRAFLAERSLAPISFSKYGYGILKESGIKCH